MERDRLYPVRMAGCAFVALAFGGLVCWITYLIIGLLIKSVIALVIVVMALLAVIIRRFWGAEDLAAHEAGHAVALHCLGDYKIRSVKVKKLEGVIYFDRPSCPTVEEITDFEYEVKICLAGQEAVRVIHGRREVAVGGRDDRFDARRFVRRMMTQSGGRFSWLRSRKLMRELRRETFEFLQREKERLTALSTILRDQHGLNGVSVHEILGRE